MVEQLEDNLDAADLQLTEKETELLTEISARRYASVCAGKPAALRRHGSSNGMPGPGRVPVE